MTFDVLLSRGQVVRALQIVCVLDTPQITNAQKLAFFNETRHAFGRSALLLRSVPRATDARACE
jgi:hypothetical protein